MERKLAPENTKKETEEYYNYEIKGYLARDYQKPKAGTEPQRKKQTQRKSQKKVLVTEVVPLQKKNHQLAVLE